MIMTLDIIEINTLSYGCRMLGVVKIEALEKIPRRCRDLFSFAWT